MRTASHIRRLVFGLVMAFGFVPAATRAQAADITIPAGTDFLYTQPGYIGIFPAPIGTVPLDGRPHLYERQRHRRAATDGRGRNDGGPDQHQLTGLALLGPPGGLSVTLDPANLANDVGHDVIPGDLAHHPGHGDRRHDHRYAGCLLSGEHQRGAHRHRASSSSPRPARGRRSCRPPVRRGDQLPDHPRHSRRSVGQHACRVQFSCARAEHLDHAGSGGTDRTGLRRQAGPAASLSAVPDRPAPAGRSKALGSAPAVGDSGGTVRRSLGWLRRRIFGISAEEVSFARRGFRGGR